MRKILALIMAVAMMAVLASGVFADDTVTVTYTFDEGKADAGLTEHGELTYADGAVTFGADGWLESDIDLTGATSLKVTAKVKAPEDRGTTAWIFDATSEASHPWPNEHYVALLFDKPNNCNLAAERYNNAGTRPAHPENLAITDDFMTIVGEFKADGSVVVSIDGEEVANVAQPEGFDLNLADCLGETPMFMIGHANWNAGEYANGMVLDEITIEATVPGAAAPADGTDAPAEDGETASQTGFATIALAIAAIGSGAYIVSKKH